MVALKDLINRLSSEVTTDVEQNVDVHGADFRSNYVFNSTIDGIEDADQILLIGTNPRHEAAVLNARIRKVWLAQTLKLLKPEQFDSTFESRTSVPMRQSIGKGSHRSYGKKLAGCQARPLIIVGSEA